MGKPSIPLTFVSAVVASLPLTLLLAAPPTRTMTTSYPLIRIRVSVEGLVVTFRWWIAAALGGVALLLGLLWLVIYPARRVDARDENRLALAGRADQ
jgi:hypothetical protein